MDPIVVITAVCIALAFSIWLLFKYAAAVEEDEPTAKTPPPFRRSGSVPSPTPIVISIRTPDPESFRRSQRLVADNVKRCITRGAPILLALFVLVGCGAREHRDNLAEVVKLRQEIAEREAAEKKKQKAALAEAAMEQREARKEVQEARRINSQLRLTGVILCLYESGTRLASEVSRGIHPFVVVFNSSLSCGSIRGCDIPLAIYHNQ